MDKVILQIPIDATLRREALRAAITEGFSSLQDAVRMYLRKLAHGEIRVRLHEQFPPVQLSPRAERRYIKMEKDFLSGKEPIYIAKSVGDLMDQLHGRKRPVREKVPQTL